MTAFPPDLAFLLHYWAVTIYLPLVVLLIIVMVLITRWQDGRDAAAARREHASHPVRLGGTVHHH